MLTGKPCTILSAQIVVSLFRHTAIITENTAATDAIFLHDLEVKKMDIQKEAMYQVTMSIVKKMFHANLISEDEYRQIDTMFREKYKPKIGTLFVDLEPEQR